MLVQAHHHYPTLRMDFDMYQASLQLYSSVHVQNSSYSFIRGSCDGRAGCKSELSSGPSPVSLPFLVFPPSRSLFLSDTRSKLWTRSKGWFPSKHAGQGSTPRTCRSHTRRSGSVGTHANRAAVGKALFVGDHLRLSERRHGLKLRLCSTFRSCCACLQQAHLILS